MGCGCWVSPGHAPPRAICSLTSECHLCLRTPALGTASGEPHASAALSGPGSSTPCGLWLLLDCGPVATAGLHWAHSLHSCCLRVSFLPGLQPGACTFWPSRALTLCGTFFCLVGTAIWFKPGLHSRFLGRLAQRQALAADRPPPPASSLASWPVSNSTCSEGPMRPPWLPACPWEHSVWSAPALTHRCRAVGARPVFPDLHSHTPP